MILCFLVHVDDINPIGFNMEAITQLITTLSTDFPLKDFGLLNYFLGIECSWSTIGLVFLNASKLIMDLL